ncbi:MAG TPA: hypothetical protein VGH49_01005 [Xanthobacteraceae bacterium]
MSCSRRLIGALPPLAGLALVASFLAIPAARADIVPLSAMMHGITMTQTQCAELAQAVWITPAGKGFCMRYYLSVAGGAGSHPVVMLQGDQLGRFDARTGRFEPAPNAPTEDTDTDNLVKLADILSRRFGGPAIYLARVGIDGSSGHHGIRHSFLELYATNQALDAIKQRYAFKGFSLIGQSGGATLVGGLLALRTDIGCAVPGSGNLALLNGYKSANSLAAAFDPAAMIPAIAKKSTARILVVTDPRDKIVPVDHQSTFVSQLRRAGGTAEQLFVEATDESHHGVSLYAVYATAACLRGQTDEEIATGLATFVEKRVAAVRAKAERDATMHNPSESAAPRS